MKDLPRDWGKKGGEVKAQVPGVFNIYYNIYIYIYHNIIIDYKSKMQGRFWLKLAYLACFASLRETKRRTYFIMKSNKGLSPR